MKVKRRSRTYAELSEIMTGFPGIRRERMTRNELRTLLLESPTPFYVWGRPYDIRSKHVGAGIYEVWLEARK